MKVLRTNRATLASSSSAKGIFLLGTLVAAIVLAVVAGTAWRRANPPEPAYQGRSLSSWLSGLDFGTNTSRYAAAKIAIREMGTNCLPALVRRLRHRDSPVKRRMLVLMQQHGLRFGEMDDEFARNRRAALACAQLGPRAVPAFSALAEAVAKSPAGETAADALAMLLPESVGTLTNLLATGTPLARERAANALAAGFSSPEAVMPAFTALTNALQSADFILQIRAISSLAQAHDYAGLVLPVLIRTLRDGAFHPNVRSIAATGLGELHAEPNVAVPALTGALNDVDAGVRQSAATSLGAFGSSAKAATPELTRLLQDPFKYAREAAARTLAIINGRPEQ